MKRIIKFRAWDKEINKWSHTWVVVSFNGRTLQCDTEKFELMQYTGLKDFWEKDIVKYENETYIIEYNLVGFRLKNNQGVWTNFPTDYGNIEKLGNLYEHKDLLQ